MNNEEKLARLWAVVMAEAFPEIDRRIEIRPGGATAFEIPTRQQSGRALTTSKAVTVTVSSGKSELANVTTDDVNDALDRLLEVFRNRAVKRQEEADRIAADGRRVALAMLTALGSS